MVSTKINISTEFAENKKKKPLLKVSRTCFTVLKTIFLDKTYTDALKNEQGVGIAIIIDKNI